MFIFCKKSKIFSDRKNSEKLYLLKKKFKIKKFQKNIFSWKENFLNKVHKKIFLRKKFTEKNSFRKNISKLIFFKNSILQKNFTNISLKNWKKKKF